MMDFYYQKNVLVAGGAGMTGQSLVRQLLDRGANVLATQYQKRKITLQHKNLTVVDANLLDFSQCNNLMKNMDIMFIAAANVGGAKSITQSPLDLISYNLKLQFGLMEAAYRSKIDRVGFVSSSYVYPDCTTMTGELRPNIETDGFQGDPWKPINYGLGWVKRYLETVCKFLHMNGTTKFGIVRPTSMYGPYDNFDLESCHAVPALIRKSVEKMDPFEIWGYGLELRCHTYIDDLVDGLLLVTDRYAIGEALNACSKDPVTINQVAFTLFDICGFKPNVKYNNSKPSAIPYKVSSPNRIKEILGWEAKTSLVDGLTKTVAWYKNNLAGEKNEVQ